MKTQKQLLFLGWHPNINQTKQGKYMCLALPGKILSIAGEVDMPMGEIDFSGVKKSVCLAYTPEAQVGDYVIVHVGFAISILNEKQAQRTLDLYEEVKGNEIR